MVRGLHRHDELKISRSKIVQYFKLATDQLKNKKKINVIQPLGHSSSLDPTKKKVQINKKNNLIIKI